jgi:hypothetical protein
VADTVRRSGVAQRSAGRSPLRRITMNSKIVKLAVAAVVVAGALAIGVETLRPRRTNQPHAFSAEIRTNMALDLDPKGAIPLRQAQPEDFDVTWDGENGGTLRIMPGSALRIMAARWNDAKWEEIVSWAHSSLTQLQESTATSISARQSRFAAILTSEGNLVVMQIGDHDEDKARLQWQVESTDLPGYSPVQVVTLACVDPDHPSLQPCAIDFDTGRTIVIPPQTLDLAPEAFLGWLEQNGIDAIARRSNEGGCLTGVGLIVQTCEPGLWTAIRALGVRDIMAGASYQSCSGRASISPSIPSRRVKAAWESSRCAAWTAPGRPCSSATEWCWRTPLPGPRVKHRTMPIRSSFSSRRSGSAISGRVC